MNHNHLDKAIINEDIHIDNPLFYSQAFTYVSHKRKSIPITDANMLEMICTEEYSELSKRLDRTKFQEGCSARNVLFARRLATLVINDKGEITQEILEPLYETLKNHLYSLGPNRHYDAKRQEQILKVIKILSDHKTPENKELIRILKTIDKPTSHKYADQIIRDTLALAANTPITDVHAKRAVLSAWMTTLRQTVGSCFATAPCIIIHDEQPKLFLQDVKELLNTGRLKRTFGGTEYSVPLSASWGAGDLKKPFLIQTGTEFEKSGLWLSPGLTSAFEAAELIETSDSTTSKITRMKLLLNPLFSENGDESRNVIVCADDIIKKVLQNTLKITTADLEDYENRQKGAIRGGLLDGGMFMQPSGTAYGGKSKGDLCQAYHNKLKAAQTALKSLTDNALLKAWEFSVASLSETKSQFTKWNLYSSLGLNTSDIGGICSAMNEVLQRKLDAANRRVSEFQYEYEMAYTQLKTMESRMRSVSSEKEGRWLKVEYESKRNEFYTLEEIRNTIHHRAKRLAGLYNILVDQYDELFPKYFQEVYDADMQDITTGQYDDSPAGFRLLYKYGRSNTSQWTYIHSPNDFIEALVSFFTATEIEIASIEELEGLQTDLSELVTAIVNHVRTNEFLESAFNRMAAAHHTRTIKQPLQNLDKIDKKPWSYTSGGSMDTLVSCYFRLDNKPTEVGRWVESPMELLTFLVDTIRQIPANLIKPFLNHSNKSMLMHSPTHAFLLKPSLAYFREAWKSEKLAYIWARDNILAPQQEFLDTLWLNEDMIHYLTETLTNQVPHEIRHFFRKSFSSIHSSMRPKEFRENILEGIHRERGLRILEGSLTSDEIDSLLYRELPLFHKMNLQERVENIFNEISSLNKKDKTKIMAIFDKTMPSLSKREIYDADTLQSICKGLICLSLNITTSSINYHKEISDAAVKLGYAMPAPLIFADTNWVKEEFGFLVNPGSNELELWRIDSIGRIGAPMSSWSQWLNGSNKSRTWGVYVKPYEYLSE